MKIRWLTPHDPLWDTWVERASEYDFYHLRGYHKLEAARLGGWAEMLVIERGEDFIATPLIFREVGRFEGDASEYVDATSVYGYTGPLSSRRDLSQESIASFQSALNDEFRGRKTVALFSRLHPLFQQQRICSGLGDLVQSGETVSIDLDLSEEDQRRQYRTNVLRTLKRAAAEGITLHVDEQWNHLEEFLSIYRETMERVGAAPSYYFDRSYTEALKQQLDSAAHLIFCLKDDIAICAGLFISTRGIVQYHLGGTRTAALPLSPMTFLFDAVRRKFAGKCRWLHLGGGLGGRQDSLFHFKSGFSKNRHRAMVWRWVIAEAIYAEVCRRSGADPDARDYFPAYRGPSAAPLPHTGSFSHRTD